MTCRPLMESEFGFLTHFLLAEHGLAPPWKWPGRPLLAPPVSASPRPQPRSGGVGAWSPRPSQASRTAQAALGEGSVLVAQPRGFTPSPPLGCAGPAHPQPQRSCPLTGQPPQGPPSPRTSLCPRRETTAKQTNYTRPRCTGRGCSGRRDFPLRLSPGRPPSRTNLTPSS